MAIFSNYLNCSVIKIELPEPFRAKGCFKDISLDLTNENKTLISLKVENNIDSNQLGVFVSHVLPNIVYDLIFSGAVKRLNVIHENKIIHEEPIKISSAYWLNQDSIMYIHEVRNEKPRKVAVFTHVYNPGQILDVWRSYYTKIVGSENLYVLDHESTDGSVLKDSNLYQVVSVPRGELDHFNISRFCSYFQRFLLSNYEWVIHTDCDEFLVTPAGPESFLSMLSHLPKSSRLRNGVTLRPSHAIELIEVVGEDSPLDWTLPLCSQRNWGIENKAFLKPAISSVPTTWTPGFHDCFDESTACPDLWMIHAKWISLDIHIHLNRAFRSQKQSNLDMTLFQLENSIDYQIQKDAASASMSKKFSEGLRRGTIRGIPEWLKGQF